MIRTLLRVVVLPVALLSGATAVFSVAFASDDLIRAGAVSILAGGLAATIIRWRRFPLALTVVPVLGALVVAVAVAPSVIVGPTEVAASMANFLSVGLPAHGLPALLVVVPLVVTPLATLTFVASALRRPLLTLAGPVLASGIAVVLVAPHPAPTWPFAALVVMAAAVLVADTRSDVSAMPPLVGNRTEERHQRSWFRPVLQLASAVGVLVVAASMVPLPGRVDVRDIVESETVRFEDPSPLSVAARWGLVDQPQVVARVDVTGDVAPGRFRLAVLDGYQPTGWHQSAEFAVTGSSLVADPLLPADDPLGNRTPTELVDVMVEPMPGLRPFRAIPTAGPAVEVDEPDGLRFAARAGVLLDTGRARPVRYTTDVSRPAPADVRTVVPDVPAGLLECPDSEGLSSVATQLTEGLVGFEERLDALEDWLLTRRIYDPAAPGGQTLASIDAFLGTPFARGNLEVFVSTHALLARCAGVPVRVVVGLPEVPVTTTEVRQDAVTAWIEVPVDGEGWVVRDPLPTPEEQERLAQLAQTPPPEPDDRDEPSETAAEDTTAPLDPHRGGGFDGRLVAVPTTALLALIAIARVVPAWIMRRRRRIADPTAAVLAAWTSVLDALVDRKVPLASAHTPQEVAQSVTGQVPNAVRRAIELLVPLVDAARYRGTPVADSEASTAWALADLAILRMPRSFADRAVVLRHPLTAARRTASVIGVPRRRRPWEAILPDAVAAVSDEAPDDIPGVSLDTRIGVGSTGTVYRGTLEDSGTDVAVKVFRFGPGDEGFDERRFEWEVQIAEEVSGLPHLPLVLGAGISPSRARPYLITTLYEAGTLLDRVRRGGLLTASEAVAIGADLATALSALHQLGVVHGDIKPENVFVAPDGWVLGDLGSAWLRAGRGPARSLTPPYAAPEVWRGVNPTPSADIYSLALTAVYARTGEVPVAGNVPDVDDARVLFPDHPELVRALDPDPRRRPRSAGELARRLRPELLASSAFADGGLSLPTPTVQPT